MPNNSTLAAFIFIGFATTWDHMANFHSNGLIYVWMICGIGFFVLGLIDKFFKEEE